MFGRAVRRTVQRARGTADAPRSASRCRFPASQLIVVFFIRASVIAGSFQDTARKTTMIVVLIVVVSSTTSIAIAIKMAIVVVASSIVATRDLAPRAMDIL